MHSGEGIIVEAGSRRSKRGSLEEINEAEEVDEVEEAEPNLSCQVNNKTPLPPPCFL
jgi:hypothetical protein